MTRDIQADKLRSEANAAADLVASLGSDDAQLNHDMVEGETSLFEAIESAIDEIDLCEIMATGCKEKESQIADRRARAERRKETLRGLIEQAMLIADVPQVKTATATLSVATVPPKPIISEESEIPAEYWKARDPVLDKTKINKDAKDGTSIPGVTMDNGGTSLKIRRT